MIITKEGDVLGSVLRSAVPGAEPDDGSIANASDDFSLEAHLSVPHEDELEYQESPVIESKSLAVKDEPVVDEKPQPIKAVDKPEPAKPPQKAALKSALDSKG